MSTTGSSSWCFVFVCCVCVCPLFPCFLSRASLQIDRRTLLDNLALVLLAIDELVDAGKILEIDPSAIANRVLMRGADARQPQASELTVQQVSDTRCRAVGGGVEEGEEDLR